MLLLYEMEFELCPELTERLRLIAITTEIRIHKTNVVNSMDLLLMRELMTVVLVLLIAYLVLFLQISMT
jgi:hypothetical protein